MSHETNDRYIYIFYLQPVANFIIKEKTKKIKMDQLSVNVNNINNATDFKDVADFENATKVNKLVISRISQV